jgi:hypothetical protein
MCLESYPELLVHLPPCFVFANMRYDSFDLLFVEKSATFERQERGLISLFYPPQNERYRIPNKIRTTHEREESIWRTERE